MHRILSAAQVSHRFCLISLVLACVQVVAAGEKAEPPKTQPKAEQQKSQKKSPAQDTQEKAEPKPKQQPSVKDAPAAKKKAEPAQPVAPLFPDKALEDAVRRQVFAKRYSDEPITKEDVAKIPHVIGAGQQIRDLSGLEHCHGLMLIDLRNNQVSDLTPIAKLTRLQSVTLSGNRIKTLEPIKHLTAMQLLDVSRNEVRDLAPLAEMENLRTLYVAENSIESLEPIAKLTKIWSLDASGNKLTDVSAVQSFEMVSRLDLRNNRLADVKPIAELRALKSLWLQNNQIKDLSPIVAACRKDAEEDNRFAPYLRLSFEGNPIPSIEKQQWMDDLKEIGVRIK